MKHLHTFSFTKYPTICCDSTCRTLVPITSPICLIKKLFKTICIIGFFSAITFGSTGCAELTHQPVKYHPYPADMSDKAKVTKAFEDNESEDQGLTGIRYYEDSPYLLVYTDGKGNLVWKIYPSVLDQTKLMVATPHQFLSKIITQMTFTNGVLTTSHSEKDSTATIKAVIASMEKILPLAFADQLPSETTIPSPRLYKIIVADNELNLIGGPGNQDIKINLK